MIIMQQIARFLKIAVFIVVLLGGASLAVLLQHTTVEAQGSALDCLAVGMFASLQSPADGLNGAVPTNDKATAKNTASLKMEECYFDRIGAAVQGSALRKMTKLAVLYMIQSDSFVQDMSTLLRNVRDQTFKEFINDEANFNLLCYSWGSVVRELIAKDYARLYRRSSQPCINVPIGLHYVKRLGIDLPNFICEKHICPFGGDRDDPTNYWDTFLRTTTSTGGNPITSYFSLSADLGNNLDHKQKKVEDDIDRGDGFRSIEYCEGDPGYENVPGEGGDVGPEECKMATPGSIVAANIKHVVGSELRAIENAPELDALKEKMTALSLFKEIQQPSGVYGLSQSGSDGKSFLDQYTAQENTQTPPEARAELLRQIEVYRDVVDQYIQLVSQSVNTVQQTAASVHEVKYCYESKYHTWVKDYNIIPPDQVDSVPAEARERATFQAQIRVGENESGPTYQLALLSPPESLENSKGYEPLVNSLETESDQLDEEIKNALVALEKAKWLEIILEGSYKPEDGTLSAAVASSSTIITRFIKDHTNEGRATIIVPLDNGSYVEIVVDLSVDELLALHEYMLQLPIFDNQAAENQLENHQRTQSNILYGQTMGDGTQSPGTLNDLARCQAFQEVYNPNPVGEEGEEGEEDEE